MALYSSLPTLLLLITRRQKEFEATLLSIEKEKRGELFDLFSWKDDSLGWEQWSKWYRALERKIALKCIWKVLLLPASSLFFQARTLPVKKGELSLSFIKGHFSSHLLSPSIDLIDQISLKEIDPNQTCISSFSLLQEEREKLCASFAQKGLSFDCISCAPSALLHSLLSLKLTEKNLLFFAFIDNHLIALHLRDRWISQFFSTPLSATSTEEELVREMAKVLYSWQEREQLFSRTEPFLLFWSQKNSLSRENIYRGFSQMYPWRELCGWENCIDENFSLSPLALRSPLLYGALLEQIHPKKGKIHFPLPKMTIEARKELWKRWKTPVLALLLSCYTFAFTLTLGSYLLYTKTAKEVEQKRKDRIFTLEKERTPALPSHAILPLPNLTELFSLLFPNRLPEYSLQKMAYHLTPSSSTQKKSTLSLTFQITEEELLPLKERIEHNLLLATFLTSTPTIKREETFSTLFCTLEYPFP